VRERERERDAAMASVEISTGTLQARGFLQREGWGANL
jgi:hypothetical protein